MNAKIITNGSNRAGKSLAGVAAAMLMASACFAQESNPQVRWPKWAEKVYEGIEAARDQANEDLFARSILPRDKQNETKDDGDDGKAKEQRPSEKEMKHRIEAWQEQWPALYELDTEIDMLASALLALQRPDVVIELYECWYLGRDRKAQGPQQLKDEPFRTPAAILNYSRAHRDRAWQYLETPPLELDRLSAFEKANQHMVKAFERLESARKSITT
ncbi:hypothetical protein D6833_10295, partial [Candidatus Parcubacteria bacterium]